MEPGLGAPSLQLAGFFLFELGSVTTAAAKLCKLNMLISVGNVDEEEGSAFPLLVGFFSGKPKEGGR